jgi:hypothetical protein
VNQREIELVLDLYPPDVDRSGQKVNVFGADDFETVLVGILEIVSVGNSGAIGMSVIEGIIAALFNPVFVGEIRLTAESFNRFVEDSPRLAGIVGVIQIDGRLGRVRRRSWRGSGLDSGHRVREQNYEKAVHDSIGLEAPGPILAVPENT